MLSLLSWAVLAGGAYLLWTWAQGYEVRDAYGVWRHVHGPAWRLGVGAPLLAWSFLGRFVVLALMPKGDPVDIQHRERQALRLANGADLAVEVSGRRDGPTLILTHGWGLDSSAWSWLRPALEHRFRLVTWDLPGLGRSTAPKDGRLTLERLAEALAAVLDAHGQRPVVLIGHSIGGMTVQTLFRDRPEFARAKAAGVVLINTTYQNPLHTMVLSRLWLALQKPVLEPMSWATVALSPLIWLSNWQSYLSGSSQLAMRLTGFGRWATGRQVDAAARLTTQGSPAVQAKGNLAMFHWEGLARDNLIDCPALVIAGSKDIVTKPIAGELIASRIRGARMSIVDGAGHLGPMEAASAYAAEIAAFAEDAFRAPRGLSPATGLDGRFQTDVGGPPIDQPGLPR